MNFAIAGFLKKFAAIALVAAVAGFVASPFKSAVAGDASMDISLRAGAGNGMLIGVLGGYRSLIADFIWIKGYVEWERRNLTQCLWAIQLATDMDPSMISFWTQGAGIIAYDTPHWIIERLPQPVSKEDEKNIRTRQGKIAIKYIDKALSIYPDNETLLLEKGKIAIAVGDFKLALQCYQPVALKPDSMVYVRRIYASLLVKNGKFLTALDILQKLYSELEPDMPVRQLVADQIKSVKILIEKTGSK